MQHLNDKLWLERDRNGTTGATLVAKLFEPCGPAHIEDQAAVAYSEYYFSRCKEFLTDGGRHVSVRKHSDIVRITHMILSDQNKGEIRAKIERCEATGSTVCHPGVADASIHLCASLLALVDIGHHEFRASGRLPVEWIDGSLRQFLAGHFAPQEELKADKSRMEKLFTGRNLSRISGIKIKWTSNLFNHLLLADDDKSVFIFHHANFLELQSHMEHPLFPTSFIEETIRTLALLFPQNDYKTRAWVTALAKTTQIDQGIISCGSLRAQDRRFERFSVWHDRLVILKQAFDDPSPKTLGQWWRDRRNGVQWYTFWVAVLVLTLTIFFGAVQSVEGALQVYLAYKGLEN